MENTKPYLLCATHRTGSTPVYQLVSHYLQATSGVVGLGEYFSRYIASYWDNGAGISVFHYPNTHEPFSPEFRYNVGGRLELEEKISSMRAKLLRKYHSRYFIKLFPHVLPFEHREWMLSHYEWIFLERKDVFEQILSCLICHETGIWYGAAPQKALPLGSLKATREAFENFELVLFNYFQLKMRRNPAIVLHYEDLRELSPRAFLAKAGFTSNVSLTGLKLTSVQRPWTKSAAFSNISEIRKWYRGSLLNELAPLAPY
ncbi:MAG: hypothetical protein HY074_16105 [Deltaproteobacteria bacterium]|nr:hypothetical protein [Deltaproteobacteria bacterium]